MTARGVDALGRWVPVARVDTVRQVRAWADEEFGAEFPGVPVWFGLATRRWWALVPAAGGWRLVEADRPDGLRMQIRGALGFWPVYAGRRRG